MPTQPYRTARLLQMLPRTLMSKHPNQEPINAFLKFKPMKRRLHLNKLTNESNSEHIAVADHKQTQTGTEVSGTLVE